ncbi:MAG: AAA family ATPase [Bacteroidia bacterium]
MSESQDYSDLSIRRLELHQVGPFKDLVLEFPCKREEDRDRAEVHIFVGENGTGKTTLLEAMTAFEGWYGWTEGGDGKVHHNTALDWRVERKMKLTNSKFDVSFSGPSIGKELKEDGGTKLYNDLEDWCSGYFSNRWVDGKRNPYLFFTYQANRFLRTAFVKPGGQLHNSRLLVEGIRWDKEPVNNALFQWIMDCDTKAAFAQRRGAKSEAEEYERKIDKIGIAVSEIVGRMVRFAIDEKYLHVRIQLGDLLLEAETLALGLQSLIGWLADLIYRLSQFPAGLDSRFALFLDEIDIHLHPKAQRKILPVIQKLFPNAQIFITTHSPFVVGSVDGAWVYKFKLDSEGYSVLDGEPRLSEDADSYRTILEEVFDIHEQFGMEAQAKLDEFYKLRKEVLNGPTDSNWREFNQLGQELASQSDEMHNYVSLELRQAARVLNRKLIA